MTTYSSIPAWRIPQAEEPGRLQSMGLQRVGHNWARMPHPRHNWYYMACVFIGLISLSIMSSSFIHVVANGRVSFFLWLNNVVLCSLFSTSLPALVISCLFNNIHSDRYEVISLWFWFAFPWWLKSSQYEHAKSLQSCLTLHNPMDCSPSGFSVHGILQARMLE